MASEQLSGDGNHFDSNANSRTCQQRQCETSIKSENSMLSTPKKVQVHHTLESDNSSRSPSPAEDVVLRLTSTPAAGDTDVKTDELAGRLSVNLPQDPCHSPVMHHRGSSPCASSAPQAKRPTNLANLSDSSVCILEDMAPMEQMCRNVGMGGGDNELRPSTSTSSRSRASTNSQQSSTQTRPQSVDFPHSVSVPIVGFEVMEERDKFTVFKIHVQKSDTEQWFIFRRYTDFVRVNNKLKELFPCFRLALPSKKYFGDNFERSFLEDRVFGLQAFLNNITGHSRVFSSDPVQEFLCLDDPPGPQDSLEESRALCESLEEQVYSLTRELQDRDTHISLLEEELALAKSQVENLTRSLRIERQLNKARRGSPMSQKSECSLVEQDQASCVEADLESSQPESADQLSPCGANEGAHCHTTDANGVLDRDKTLVTCTPDVLKSGKTPSPTLPNIKETELKSAFKNYSEVKGAEGAAKACKT